MLRALIYGLFNICTLCTVTSEINFKDGLKLSYIGWPIRLTHWLKERKEAKASLVKGNVK